MITFYEPQKAYNGTTSQDYKSLQGIVCHIFNTELFDYHLCAGYINKGSSRNTEKYCVYHKASLFNAKSYYDADRSGDGKDS